MQATGRRRGRRYSAVAPMARATRCGSAWGQETCSWRSKWASLRFAKNTLRQWREGPSDFDHAYHEFVALRAATDRNIASLEVAGSLADLLVCMRSTGMAVGGEVVAELRRLIVWRQ